MFYSSNQRGFSLVESIIAIAMLSGAISLGMSFFKNSLKQSVTASTGFEIAAIVNEIRGSLYNKDICELNFKDIEFDDENDDPITIDKILFAKDFAKYQAKEELDDVRVKIESFAVKKISDEAFKLFIAFDRGKTTSKYTTKKSIEIKGTFADNKFSNCYAVSSGQSFIWSHTEDGIFYKGNNVGIGTTSPKVSLDVQGPIKIGPGVFAKCEEGAIQYRNNNFQKCLNDKWVPLISFSSHTVFDASAGSTTNMATQVICALSKVEQIASSSDGCEIGYNPNSNVWTLFSLGNAICSAICLE